MCITVHLTRKRGERTCIRKSASVTAFQCGFSFFLLNTFKIVSPDMIMSKCTMRRNLAQRTLASSLILDKKQIKKLNKKPKTTKIPTLQ